MLFLYYGHLPIFCFYKRLRCRRASPCGLQLQLTYWDPPGGDCWWCWGWPRKASPSVGRTFCSPKCLVSGSSNTRQIVGYKCVIALKFGWKANEKISVFWNVQLLLTGRVGLLNPETSIFSVQNYFFFFGIFFPASSKSKWYRIRTIFHKCCIIWKVVICQQLPLLYRCALLFYILSVGEHVHYFFQIPVSGNHR